MDTPNKTSAYLDGWAAHRYGRDVEHNPYDEHTQARSHYEWMSGWCGRFGAIKNELDLSLDDQLFS